MRTHLLKKQVRMKTICNSLKITLVPFLSLIFFVMAIHAFASVDEKLGFYILDTIKLPAPGSDMPDKLGTVRELDYYRWIYQVIPPNNIEGSDPIEEVEDRALSEAGLTRDDLKDLLKVDAKKKETFENLLKGYLLESLKNRNAGPYQSFGWQWYREETQQAEVLAKWQENSKEWQNAWVLNYLAQEKMKKILAAEISALAKERADAQKPSLIGAALGNRATPYIYGAEWDYKNRQKLANFEQRKQALVKQYLKEFQTSNVRAEDLAEAEREYGKERDLMLANPYFSKNIIEKIAQLPTADQGIYIDIENSLKESILIENDSSVSNSPANSIIGFNTYAILPYSAETILDVFLFRNGLPPRNNSDENQINGGITFPFDSLFKYRREIGSDVSQYWGANSYLNQTFKFDSVKGGWIDSQANTHALFYRGNAKEGYDIYFQFLGAACTKDMNPKKCNTPTKSNFTILSLRPISANKTAYKMYGRYVGQSYKFLPQGKSDVGYNIENFLTGQVEFNEMAAHLEESRKILSEAKASGKSIVPVSSETGYYFSAKASVKTLIHLNEGEKPDPKLHRMITLNQRYFLVEEKLIQLIPDRGDMLYDGKAMLSYPLE